MQNSELIRTISLSLRAGQKVYKFSELRDLLAKEGVDVSNFNLRRKNDQQALLGITEKYLYDFEQEERMQANIQDFEDAINSELEDDINSEFDEYPDIPLTYAWQFEGVDTAGDFFLAPQTPLTCDILNGQYCQTAVSNKGFSEACPVSVESVYVTLLADIQTTMYRPEKHDARWIDLDEFTTVLGVAFSPEYEKVKVVEVVPKNGKYQGKKRRAIDVASCAKVLAIAANSGNRQADFLYREIVMRGMAQVGIDYTTIHNSKVIPKTRDGQSLDEFIMKVGELGNHLIIDGWLLLENDEFHDADSNTQDVTNLPMLINMMVALVSGRKTDFSVPLNYSASAEFIEHIFPDYGLDSIIKFDRLTKGLLLDDEIYRDFCEAMLSEIRKIALVDVLSLPERVRECTEVKSIIEVKTSKDPGIRLVNGWLHPLAEVKKDIPGADGKAYCNAWQFASMVVGGATERCPNADSDSAIRILIDFDVIESEGCVTLEQAKSDDAIYLQLVGAMKEAFEVDIEKQLNQLD